MSTTKRTPTKRHKAAVTPNDDQYYYAIIGPVSRAVLDEAFPNGEGHLRASIQAAFDRLFPDHRYSCASGWGVSPAAKDAMHYAYGGDDTRKALIRSYHVEGKPMPRALRAWELLFEEESR